MKLFESTIAPLKISHRILLLSIALIFTSGANAEIQITEFLIEEGEVRIVFEDTEGIATEFSLQSSISLAPRSWVDLPAAAFSALDETRFLFTVPLANVDNEFFRIATTLIIGTALDPDGDGLPEALEELIGTNPDVYDTDNDGFSDGLEYGYGTDPTSSSSVPDLTVLPRAEFAQALSSATEGAGLQSVTVRFDQPYFGSLKYGVLPLSTAESGVDYQPLTFSVLVEGTSVEIPITWLDDDLISPERILYLDIETDDTLLYARGGQTRHTIVLSENDSYWFGVLSDKYAQRNFQLKLVRNGSSTEATFAAGAGNDGLPLLEGETEGSRSNQSVGVVPEGSYPATVEADSTSNFKIISPLMPASSGGLFGASTGLTRSLTLESSTGSSETPDGNEISALRVIGNYTECLAFPGDAPCATQTGTFVLLKQLSAPPSAIQ